MINKKSFILILGLFEFYIFCFFLEFLNEDLPIICSLINYSHPKQRFIIPPGDRWTDWKSSRS